VLEESKRWADLYGSKQSPAPHTNERTGNRKLRIGYVSPDFKSHPVSHFVEPLLSSHDRENFEIFCYSHLAKPDAITHVLRSQAQHWREIFGRNDDDVEKMIREDKIDILCDLAGHTGNNRLTLFSRKPAPVQVSLIGYPCTTGIPQIDYKIADPRTDPPEAQRFYSEKLWRLPNTFWVYRPLDDQEGITPLPALSAGHVTFGSLNNFAKVTDEVLDLWARIVAAVPGSRMHMQTAALGSDTARQRAIGAFEKHGVSDDRLTLTGWSNFADYVDLIRSFDLALDPFPFNGGTTTCHQLFYGVPCISLAGERQVSRMGVSLLTAIGHSELVAQSQDEYFNTAVALAKDLPRLSEIRQNLRSATANSPLCDAAGYTRDLEKAFREMFQLWCDSAAG